MSGCIRVLIPSTQLYTQGLGGGDGIPDACRTAVFLQHPTLLRRDLGSVNEGKCLQWMYSAGTSVFHCHSHAHLNMFPHTYKHALTHVSMQKDYKREKEGQRICVTWKQRGLLAGEGDSAWSGVWSRKSGWRCHNEPYVQYTPTSNALKIVPHSKNQEI